MKTNKIMKTKRNTKPFIRTYKKVIEAPLLEIHYDHFASSPREDENLTIMLIRNFRGDSNHNYLHQRMETLSQEVSSADEHLELLTKEVENFFDSKVVYSNFLNEYRHSGSKFSLGQHRGFDYSNNGFIFVTQKQLDRLGVQEEDILKHIETELDIFNQWINGEIYYFILYNDEGELIDRQGMIFGLENIKEYLPSDWQDEDLFNYIDN